MQNWKYIFFENVNHILRLLSASDCTYMLYDSANISVFLA